MCARSPLQSLEFHIPCLHWSRIYLIFKSLQGLDSPYTHMWHDRNTQSNYLVLYVSTTTTAFQPVFTGCFLRIKFSNIFASQKSRWNPGWTLVMITLYINYLKLLLRVATREVRHKVTVTNVWQSPNYDGCNDEKQPAVWIEHLF